MIKLITPSKTLIGMIHVAALPGTPKSSLSMSNIIEQALEESQVYLDAGFDALMIENMHDIPYLNTCIGAEIVASMTAIACELRKVCSKPIGIQILAAANQQALAVANAAGLDFIRAEGFVYGHLADEGYIESCAGELLRYRKAIGAEPVAIFTDIKKKHSSHALTSDVSLAETVKTAEFFLSDGIIITGTSTGSAAQISEVQTARLSTKLPVIVGSGINAQNLHLYWPHSDAFIIGSSVKTNGDWKNSVEKKLAMEVMSQAKHLRNNT